jgi:4-alpha-glucanotransferase
VIGDIPIFVAMDSADVWANTGLFQFDERLRPTGISGVPPD